MDIGSRSRPWCRRLAVLTLKELHQLRRDVPLLLFLVYSFSLSVYVSGAGMTMQLKHAALVVHDGDHSFLSRDLIHRFHEPYFRFAGEVPDAREGLRRLDEGEAMVVLDIPPRFQEAIRGGEPAAVQLQVDTTSAPQGLSAAGYAARIIGGFALERGAGLSGPAVTSAHRVWFNPNQDDTWFQSISHILRMVTLFAMMLPAAALVREKERGTVEQLLVAPVTPFQIMFSKVLAMTAVLLLCTAVAVYGVLRPVFGVPMKGSPVLFFALTALYTFTTAGLGLLAATVARNQAQIGMLSLLVVAPMLLLSGITTPYEAMPAWVQSVMGLSPLRYYIQVTYGILLKGLGAAGLWESILAMAVLGGALFGFGMWRFRRQFE